MPGPAPRRIRGRIHRPARAGPALYGRAEPPAAEPITKAHTKAWSARVDAADAFVFVTPEYNYGVPAALKNAIDYLNTEWAYKPVGFVSYGGIFAGYPIRQP